MSPPPSGTAPSGIPEGGSHKDKAVQLVALEVGIRDVSALDADLTGGTPRHEKSLAIHIACRAICSDTRSVLEVSAIHKAALELLLNIRTALPSEVLILIRLYPLHGGWR